MSNNIATLQKISDLVDEYKIKSQNIISSIDEYQKACNKLESQLTIGGQFAESFSFQTIFEYKATSNLLKSAWKKVYNGLNIEKICSASDRNKFTSNLDNGNLPEFTLENIRATFGDYLLNPRQNILRALAEVFCSLDPYYKSHNKIKFGSEKMPKRVVFTNLSNSYGWGFDKFSDTLRALFTYQNRRQLDYNELRNLMDNPTMFKDSHGVELRRFKNGNAHLHFSPATVKDINRALAEYYGDVLPDTPQETDKPQQSTAVSKDLQYYPTPAKIVSELLDGYDWKNKKVLEPSCGCGRIMDGLRSQGASVAGVEVDTYRAQIARDKGHYVQTGNFLEVQPQPIFDAVVMNPPFYGTHYFKHIEHAKNFIKPGGKLIAILPASARYDHDLIQGGQWYDLPIGSFAESGTNINTCKCVIYL